ncbi:MAG: carboxypeptidase-like regulatory domain-containing protein, partial [Leadbetterella sp.]
MKIRLTLFICSMFCFYFLEAKYPENYKPKFQSYTINGRLVDNNNEPLPGATIRIQSLNLGATTNLQGEFTIYNVSSGTHEISFSYLGYIPSKTTVLVDKNINLGTTALQPSINSLGEVIILSSVEGQQKAYNQQKNSDNIKNIVSSDLMNRFPDLNVAEAIQRVSGVAIQRDNGEGSIVQIRGTPLNYTTVAVNGEQIPSTDEGGNRSESLDLISADQLSSMEITKAITPDMDADATGGSVNLITPTAKSAKLNIKGTLGGGFNTLYQKGSGTFRFNADKRFFKEKLGVLFGASYYNTVNGEHRAETIYSKVDYKDGKGDVLEINDFRLRPLLNTRRRMTLTSTIDYKFNPNSKIYLNVLFSNLNDASLRNAVRIRPRSGTYTNPTTAVGNNVEIRRELNDRIIDKKNLTLNLGGKHLLGQSGIRLDYEGFYTKSERNLNSVRTNFRRRNFTLNVDRSNPDFPILSSPNFKFDDYSQYTFLSRENDNAIVNEGQNLIGKFNLTKSYKIQENTLEIKAGSKYRVLNNERNRNTTIHDQINGVYTLDQVLGSYDVNLFDTYQLGLTPNGNAAEVYFNDNFNAFTANTNQERGVNDGFYYTANERVFANYIQGKISLKKLMILAGVRLENTEVNYDAIKIERTPSGI